MTTPPRLLAACAALLLAGAAAAQPPTAPPPRPVTAEVLIDRLTEYQTWGWDEFPDVTTPHPGEAAFLKLAEMGFDAVPALLDHANDPRETRHTIGDTTFVDPVGLRRTPRRLRVGDLVRGLLHGYAGDGSFTRDSFSGGNGKQWEKQARAWWEIARPIGEEKWLTTRVTPPADGDDRTTWWPSETVLRALGVKYPNRLGEIYRSVLRTRPKVESRELARAVAASNLPRAEKLALLEEGATHRRLTQRGAALDALSASDQPTFHKHLLATLKQLPPDVSGVEWEAPELELVQYARKTDDPACWDALTAIGRRASVKNRLALLWQFNRDIPDDARPVSPEVDRRTRRERMRFLAGFLADPDAIDPAEFQPELDEILKNAREDSTDPYYRRYGYTGLLCYYLLEVRDVAALLLTQELGWEFGVKQRGPEARRVIREAVREAAVREIAGRK